MTLAQAQTDQVTRRRFRSRLLQQSLWGLVLFLSTSHALMAGGDSQLRVQVGLKLFRAMMTADQQVAQKADQNGLLQVVLVYADDRHRAQELADELALDLAPIQSYPVQVSILTHQALAHYGGHRPLGIFIVQRMEREELQQLIQFSIARQVLLFSPFEGDVEAGVLGGLAVEASVRPFINLQTLQRSKVQIKPFYLKVAKVYE